MAELKEILKNFRQEIYELDSRVCMYDVEIDQREEDKAKVMDQTTAEIKSLFKGKLPKKKKKIDITKKMCHNLEYPTSCLYDKPNPNGATCLNQDRGIPKEKCDDYKDMQVEYEDFAQYNQALTEIEKIVEEL